SIYRAHFSPDGHWVVFHDAHRRGTTQELVAPFHGLARIPHTEWIPVTDGKDITDAPRWGLDGVIYYQSRRDGHFCIWGQRVDPSAQQPVGAPFAIYHSHGRQRSLGNVAFGFSDIAIARDKIVFPMGELT